eukprot:scaffold126206_cov17-Prasinocladus_malaysianus.AAC.2
MARLSVFGISLLLVAIYAVNMMATVESSSSSIRNQFAERIVALIADTGYAVGRCKECVNDCNMQDQAMVYVSPFSLNESPSAHWKLDTLANGKIAFRSVETDLYLSRCNGCTPGSIVFGHRYCARRIRVRQPVGPVRHCADTGNYVGRCHDCYSNGAGYPDSLMVHVASNSSSDLPPYALFELVTVRPESEQQ